MSEQQKNLQPGAQGTYPQANDEMTIDLAELFFRLLSRWKLIACLALVFALAFGLYTHFGVTPMYEAKSTIYVISRSDSVINMADLQLGSALTADYIKVFDIWEVHEEVISELNLPYSYGQMSSMIRVVNANDTRMLDIYVKSADPSEAAAIANAYATVGSQYIAETMATDRPNIMSVARVPSNPVSPSKTKNVMLGFILGAMLGAGIVVIQQLIDDKYKTAEDIIRYAKLPNLATVPVEENQGSHKREEGRV